MDIKNIKIYGDKLFLQIKSILGCPKFYAKLPTTKKRIIYEKLKNLSVIAENTGLFNDSINEINCMEHEYYEFETIMNTELNKKIDRKNSGDFINKISETIDYLINKLKNEGFIENDINVSDILESINLKKIYYSVLIESVRNSIIHIPKNKDYSLDIKDNQIIFSYFHKKINKKIILYICLIILEGNIQKFHIIEKIYGELNAISSSKDIDFIDHTSYQLIESFTMSSSFKIDVIYIQSSASHKSLKLLTLPKKLMENFVSSTHMPEILPSNFKFDNPIDMMILSKQMKNGIASVKLSSKSKKSFKIFRKIKSIELIVIA